MNTRHLLFAILCSLCLCGETFAALDGEAKKPYKLIVVLHFAENRLLTSLFQDRVERELHDGLQAALGDLAEVEVVRQHPKLAEVLDKGLRSLDGWQQRSDVKTHFVLIDFSGSNYELQARQHDGLTGLATPVVRREQTQDREFVARTAALMIERDFGAVATFQAWPKENKKPQKVQLELKGGGLDGPLNRWVQKGDVFAVVQIPIGNGMGRLVPDAIVQIETPPQSAGDSLCMGNLFWRHKMSSGAGVAGYRCVKLGAMRGPLQVQLVSVKPDGKPEPLRGAPALQVRRDGFSGEGELRVTSSPKVHGLYDTSKFGEKGQFDRVAFVTVYDRKPLAEIPIVLLDDQPVVVAVTLQSDDAVDAGKEKLWWRFKVYDSYAVQSDVFTELQEMSAKKASRPELIKKAKEGLKRSEEDLLGLKEERLKVYGSKLTSEDQRDLAQADQRIKAIEDGKKQLEDYIKKQEAIDKAENSPERKQQQELEVRAGLLEKDGELGKAIAIYGEILQGPDYKGREDLEKRRDKLRKLWEPKSEKHREARDFIYNTWPTLDTTGLMAQMDAAHAALKECRTVGDIIGPQKLFKGIQIHAARLLKEAEGLRPVNMGDEEQLKVIKSVGADLGKLEAEIKAYLDKTK